MCEIIGRITPEELRSREIGGDPQFARFVREENARARVLHDAARLKKIREEKDARAAAAKVQSGKFNSIKVR
jgi:hypothetical protein